MPPRPVKFQRISGVIESDGHIVAGPEIMVPVTQASLLVRPAVPR